MSNETFTPFICVTVNQLKGGDIDISIGKPSNVDRFELIDYGSLKIYWYALALSGIEHYMILTLIIQMLKREGITFDYETHGIPGLPKATLGDGEFKTAVVVSPQCEEYGMQVDYAGYEDIDGSVGCVLPDGRHGLFMPSELFVTEEGEYV